MKIVKNLLLNDEQQRPIATDIFFREDGRQKPVVVYAHGFNGFKDWGNFDLIAKQFADAGFTFIKFNFSFNGTTPEQPEAFVDLDAYAQNNYTKELANLDKVINWATSEHNPFHEHIDPAKIGLLGHSMGGGIALLQASMDDSVGAITTWAAISECKTPWGSWPNEKLDEWRAAGVAYIANTRTKQQLPLGYQLFEDYHSNEDRLSIENAVRNLGKPLLICHGTEDNSVSIKSAHKINEWKPDAEFFDVPSDHVFGRKHPWENEDLPKPMQDVVARSIAFFKKYL